MWPFKRKPKVHVVHFGDEIHIRLADDNTKAILMLNSFTVDYKYGTAAEFVDKSHFLERNTL